MVALHAGNALIALTLPLANRIEFIPSGHQLRLLLRYTELVSIAHVKLGTGNGTARPGRWLGQLIPEVDLHRALTVLLVSIVPLAVHKVAAVAVHLTNRRLQVVQVDFDTAIAALFGTVFMPAVLPALALMTKAPGRNHVLPLDAPGTISVFTYLVTAGCEVRHAFFSVPVNFTAAVEATRGGRIDLRRIGFSLVEAILVIVIQAECSGKEGWKQQGNSQNGPNFARHIPVNV